jgi:uncharacterized protein
MKHESYTAEYISDILRDTKTIAMVGASNNEVRPSSIVMKYLMGKGYTVVPVNPGLVGQTLHGQKVLASLSDIGQPIDMVDIFRNSEAAGKIVDEALGLTIKPKVIWMQLSVRNDVAAEHAEASGLKVVMDRCPKMEFGKISGEWGWVGGNSGQISSRRPALHASGKFQSLGIPAKF